MSAWPHPLAAAPSGAPRALPVRVPAREGARLGRFELRRRLGDGAQATVWLAHDPQLQREVALKVAHDAVPEAQAEAPGGWLREARHVSRLTHPGIVPLFECFVHGGLPCLVFEYVPGETLAQHLRTRGALPARRAVEVALAILEALEAAHAAGLVHRDLKPSNVLIDPTGRVRVMDFGIAAPIADGADGRVMGTPGYMSPEAAQGRPPTPAMDLFALGLVLAEMLSGRRVLAERDPMEALRRVQAEDLALPADLGADTDDTLRALLRRAIVRDPAQRWDTAAALRESLSRWLEPPAEAAGEAGTHGTLEFLLRRMRLKSDFPALSSSMARIQRITASDGGSIRALAEEVMQDVALTQKLLRMVNAAAFRHVGAGTITTVSRAVALLGFSAIRQLSLSLVLLEHLNNKPQADHLRERLLQALLAGHVAAELAGGGERESEEVFLGAMFQNLGRLLCEHYLPEEAAEVRRRLGATEATPADEARVSTAVLGLSYEAIGLGVAQQWGLPESLQRCMRRPPGGLADLRPGADRELWWCVAANDAAQAVATADDATRLRRLKAVARAHAAAGESPQGLDDALGRALRRLGAWVRSAGLRLPPGSPMARRLDEAMAARRGATPSSPAPLAVLPEAGPPTLVLAGAPAAGDDPTLVLPADAERQGRVLADGIDRIAEQVAGDRFELQSLLRDVMDTLAQALSLRRVVFALRDPRDESLNGRLASGDAPAAMVASFRVPLRVSAGTAPHLFTAVCLKGVDTVIADAASLAVAARLPAWYVPPLWSPTFLLLPIHVRQAPVGLLYADRAVAGSIVVAERELRLVRTLRNQVALALRSSR